MCRTRPLRVHKAHGAHAYGASPDIFGLFAKTDPIDARVLALYGLKTQGLRLYVPLTPAELVALRDLKGQARDRLQQMLIAETNRLEHAPPPA